ncbi:MAG: ABC transporter permease [Cellulomonadaceae bacterium]
MPSSPAPSRVTAPRQSDTRAETTHEETIGAVEAGLDALQTQSGPRRSAWRRVAGAAYPPVLAVTILLAAWQGVVWLGVQPIYNLPGPVQVWQVVVRTAANGTLWEALGTSLERGVLGFAAAVVIGTPLGVVVARVRWVRLAFGPLITGLQVLPSVAWVPAAIIWFGLSDATVYFVILMGAVPSIVNGIVAGVDQVPPIYRRVGLVLGAGRFAMVKDVILPASLPGYLAGLKQGWAFSWRSLMAAELIAVGGSIGFGLGALLQQGRELSDMALVFTAIILILVVGIAVELAFFAPVERALLRRRGLAAETAQRPAGPRRTGRARATGALRPSA